ncbi:MAG TPA: leucyl/phenylalanyl-tRNA--protein transferase, partial [Saprospiraceae bacterium]|nr:leucyl/phenylalanyl-tRNA--protein transferase [Saprospiraceae bacterium]
MPVFALDDQLIFPHPVLSEPDGLMAIGGDLSVDRLLLAYRWGIFPWYHGDQPILWWWIAPRLMLRPDAVHISKSMRTLWRNHKYRISIDEQFTEVMMACRNIPRLGQDGTWITDDMIQAYTALHLAGYAHSV